MIQCNGMQTPCESVIDCYICGPSEPCLPVSMLFCSLFHNAHGLGHVNDWSMRCQQTQYKHRLVKCLHSGVCHLARSSSWKLITMLESSSGWTTKWDIMWQEAVQHERSFGHSSPSWWPRWMKPREWPWIYQAGENCPAQPHQPTASWAIINCFFNSPEFGFGMLCGNK